MVKLVVIAGGHDILLEGLLVMLHGDGGLLLVQWVVDQWAVVAGLGDHNKVDVVIVGSVNVAWSCGDGVIHKRVFHVRVRGRPLFQMDRVVMFVLGQKDFSTVGHR